MQLQQLRYLLAAAEHGSFRAASQKLFVSQSSLSVAVKDLEQETGVSIFKRTSRGISLTTEGIELIDYARRIVEQADLMAARYSREGGRQSRFAVSSQHYSLVVAAFGDFLRAHDDPSCEFVLRETYTNEIIRDVQDSHSELGIIYLSNYNDRVINRALDAAGLGFTSLFVAEPHAVIRRGHPLAGRRSITPDELDTYYRFEQEQGIESSSYYSEEPLSAIPHRRKIAVSDNGTMAELISQTDGYALSTGVLPVGDGLTAVPLATDEIMNVGVIRRRDARESDHARMFLELLSRRIRAAVAPIEASSLVYDYTREPPPDDIRPKTGT